MTSKENAEYEWIRCEDCEHFQRNLTGKTGICKNEYSDHYNHVLYKLHLSCKGIRERGRG